MSDAKKQVEISIRSDRPLSKLRIEIDFESSGEEPATPPGQGSGTKIDISKLTPQDEGVLDQRGWPPPLQEGSGTGSTDS